MGTTSSLFNNNLSDASLFIFKIGVMLLMILTGGHNTGSSDFSLGKSCCTDSIYLGSSFGVEIYQLDPNALGSGVVDRAFSLNKSFDS